MIRIILRDNEPLEKTLRRLRKLCNNAEVTKGIKRSAFYEKPSERRRRRERERQKAIRLANNPSRKRRRTRSR